MSLTLLHSDIQCHHLSRLWLRCQFDGAQGLSTENTQTLYGLGLHEAHEEARYLNFVQPADQIIPQAYGGPQVKNFILMA